MRRTVFFITATLLLALMALTACHSNDEEPKSHETLIFFFPYSGLERYIEENISAVKKGIEQRGGLQGQRVVVFQARSTTTANLFEIVWKNEQCVTMEIVHNMQVAFPGKDHTTAAENIRKVMTQITAYAPAEKYSMVIGSHGSAWLPSGVTRLEDMNIQKSFGTASTDYQIDNAVFAKALKDCGIHLEYILFDACYMGNMETLYDFKDVCTYFISSPTEVLNTGVPYQNAMDAMLTHNYRMIADMFCDYYIAEGKPYATMSVADCRHADAMADIARRINAGTLSATAKLSEIQNFDGMYAPVFYDLNDYFTTFCTDESLKREFTTCMASLVTYERHTPKFYTSFSDYHIVTIDTCCGLTLSQPTENINAQPMLRETAWWKATHQ